MRIVCAPDSFKGSLSALDAARAMERGVRRARPDAVVDVCPVADGGEGTVRTMVDATGGELHTTRVQDPIGRNVDAQWGLLGGLDADDERSTAVVEMAAAAGLTLLSASERDPARTSTYGVGQLIATALDAGAHRVLVGLGGSATNDGGCGAAQALGVRFVDDAGKSIDAPITGSDLAQIAQIDVTGRDPRLGPGTLELCCDVDNPLTGEFGAAAVYSPQKGATREQVAMLDAGLAHLGALWRSQLGVDDVVERPGAGAAGGTCGGFLAMLVAEARRGIDLVLETVRFAERIAGADLCLTGEGRLDRQSVHGKACFGVARAAATANVPVIGLFGTIAPDAPSREQCAALGMGTALSLAEGIELEDAMRRAAELLEQRTESVIAE